MKLKKSCLQSSCPWWVAFGASAVLSDINMEVIPSARCEVARHAKPVEVEMDTFMNSRTIDPITDP